MNMNTPTNRIHVGVLGGSGYTGLEVLRVLRGHDGVAVRFATSDSEAGRCTPVSGLSFVRVAEAQLDEVEVVFLCLPHGEAAKWVDAHATLEARVVDLTADHRPGSGREAKAVYGLADVNPAEVAAARLVANPGCYPTGVIMSLLPLDRVGLIDRSRPIVISAASGVTGAGRSPKRELLFAEVAGDFRAYGLGNEHRHLKEMRATLPGLQLLFVPHLLPVARGILETIALPVRAGVDAARVKEEWRQAYGGCGAVRVVDEGPSLAGVAHTDLLALSAYDNTHLEVPTLTVLAALDNLGKGAAGQAVQNMNLMLGWDPARGIRC
ncbi:MAG: N-acetyl-gamma-glutamyl-phosphate reductase [Gemmatimonadetes bacterium]|nr:N-acetyl-gamma-glutamyl-phosphate reductase [Gemmatimonadota bacterium]